MTKSILPKTLKQFSWETMTEESALKALLVTRNGLTQAEAELRLQNFGENKLPEGKKDSVLKRFLMQFNNALIYVLLGASVLTILMNHWLDTGVILGVVFINAIVGYIQEDKAQKALEGIRKLLALKASIVRDGVRKEVVAELLVPGDIVILKAGDKIPADMRLINISRFEVDESSLTGESVAVYKELQPVDAGTILGDRKSMAYAGTTVSSGDAMGVVTATGIDTEVGKINMLLAETKSTTTPLIRKINGLGKKLSAIILSFSVLLVFYAVLITDRTWTDTVVSVIGLAVAAIPEGLPAIVTITLAIGVQRMAKRNAIIRRLPSVETLGAVTVICSDKTGTLTKNEMTATNIYLLEDTFSVSGLGYAPKGKIFYEKDNANINTNKNSVLYNLIQSADLCNDSEIVLEEDIWLPQGAPTEAALKTLARKAKVNNTFTNRIDNIPFDSKYKYKAALCELEGKKTLFVNGAPEKLITICGNQATVFGSQPINEYFWEDRIKLAASKGQRLIGCAFKEMPESKTDIGHSDLDDNLIFLGIVGIIDPPRPEAIEAIEKCKQAGIQVKMITGDHVLTAREIGLSLGLTDRQNVISGVELESMDEEQLREAVCNCDIFARTSPEHKLKLVKALQETGEIVAMTGDGVNDAPALKRADIGVAMGIKGTEVSKDSSEMVLVDDNFSSIVSAVEEGRTIYDNIRKTLLFIFPTNGAEALVIIAALLFSFIMPITAVQILWVNMVTAVTLALSLAFEPTEINTMKNPPRDPKEAILGGYFLFRIVYVACIIGLLTIFLFNLFKNTHDIAYARTIAVNTLVFCEMFYLLNCRNLHQSLFGHGFFKNKIVFIVSGVLILIQLTFTYFPFMQRLFATASLEPLDWLYPLIGGILVMIIVELEKRITTFFLRNKK